MAIGAKNTMSMRIVNGLKLAMKARRVTYGELGRRIQLSEPSVKRILSRGTLTVARLEEGANLETSDSETSNSAVVVGVTIIPHTYANTTLGHAKPGARFNIEVDVLAKHVEKLLAGSYRGSTAP